MSNDVHMKMPAEDDGDAISPKSKLNKLIDGIELLISFLDEHQALILSHLNDFIVKDLRTEHCRTSHQDFSTKCQQLSNIGCCYNFGLDYCHSHCLEQIKDRTAIDLDYSNDSSSKKQNTFLSCKKSHETSFLSASISMMCRNIGCEKIVDVGSGKGYLGQQLSDLHGLSVLGIEASFGCSVSAEQRKVRIQKSSSNIKSTSKCKTINYAINTDGLDNSSKLVKMIDEQFPTHITDSALLVALHACGDLTSNTLKLFTREAYFKGLQVVGCCYNLLTEHSCSQGFPLSDYLTKRKYTLGKNAFMLACQCPEKWIETNQVLHKSLLYRAILEKLFVDKEISRDVLANLKFRSVGKKSKSFTDYADRVCKNLAEFGVEITLCEAEMYYQRYEDVWEDLQAYHWLRMQLAPCIEKLILLDRLCYLLESGFFNASIVKVFSPAISPRCFALICHKTNEGTSIGPLG